MEPEADLAHMAAATEGFSGADLRAIISEAQLAAVHRHLENLQARERAGGAHDKQAQHTLPLISQAVRHLPAYTL